jgi:eukaryotic translation initiation factor 2C
LIDIQAKILTQPSLSYSRDALPEIRTASWSVRDLLFVRAADIGALNIFIITEAELRAPRSAADLRANMVSRLHLHGLQATPGSTAGGRLHDFSNFWAINNVTGRSEARGNRTTLIVLENLDTGMHPNIKRLVEVNHGVHTLCILGGKIDYIRKKNPMQDPGFACQFLSNYALKFNSKFGGLNHRLSSTALDLYLGDSRNSTIILGADVTHPTHGDVMGFPSIACVVGSTDHDFQNYPGSMRLQGGRVEVSKV